MPILTNEERLRLLKRHETARDKREADRIKVVLWYDEGRDMKDIAALLFMHVSAVYRYLASYKKEKRLKPNHKGSNPILTQEESETLAKHVQENCYVRVKDIQEHIRITYDKKMSLSCITDWLKKNDFVYKKPKLQPKANSEDQKEFVEHYKKLLKWASLDNTPVLFIDAVHPSQQTRPSYGWIKKGEDKIIEIHNGRKRMNIMGAINLENMSFEYKEFETIDSKATIEFFKQLESAYPNALRIDLILDNAPYHRSEEVQVWLQKSRIKLNFLPPRSPNLNSIERLWKVMHEYVSNNKVYEKFKDFKSAVLYFFDNTMPHIKNILVDRLNDNFHIP